MSECFLLLKSGSLECLYLRFIMVRLIDELALSFVLNRWCDCTSFRSIPFGCIKIELVFLFFNFRLLDFSYCERNGQRRRLLRSRGSAARVEILASVRRTDCWRGSAGRYNLHFCFIWFCIWFYFYFIFYFLLQNYGYVLRDLWYAIWIW